MPAKSEPRSFTGVVMVAILLCFLVTIDSKADATTAIPTGYGVGSGFCTSVGGSNLGASFDNVYPCGPRPGSSFPDSGDLFQPSGGFQCTEFANRFLFDVWHRQPIFGASLTGSSYVDTAHSVYPAIAKFSNGTVGQPYLPGDIVSFTDKAAGHVAVVMSSTYAQGDGGNYQIAILDENGLASGSTTAKVTNWLMATPSGINETPYDFLALASIPPRIPTATSAANHVLRVSANGAAYFVDSKGVPHGILDALTYECDIVKYPLWNGVTQAQVNSLGNGKPSATRCAQPKNAANHIHVVSATNTYYWAGSNGVPHWIPSAKIFDCLVNKGYSVIRRLSQSQINSLGKGRPWATCGTPTTATTSPQPPTVFANGDSFNETCVVAWPTAPVITQDSIVMTMTCSNVPEGEYLFTQVHYGDPNLDITPDTGDVQVIGKVVGTVTSEFGFKELVVAASDIKL